MAPRLAAAVAVVFLVAAVHARLGEGGGSLRGSVACLDCAPGHDLSGVVVVVRCGGGDGAAAGLRAAQTDERGGFEVPVPANGDGGRRHPRCAARVLGGAEQLCAPGRLAVAPVVAADGDHGREPGSTSYALGSRLAVFTRCGGALATTKAAAGGAGGEQKSPATPRSPRTTPRQTPAGSTFPPRGAAPRYDGPGLPLIYFFPFLPIIGIP